MKTKNNIRIEEDIVLNFLHEYSIKPVDNGFTESVMEKLPRRNIKWGNVLQYASYALAIIAAVGCVYVMWINNILTAPKDLVGLTARIITNGIYISLILVAIGIYVISNYSDKFGLDQN